MRKSNLILTTLASACLLTAGIGSALAQSTATPATNRAEQRLARMNEHRTAMHTKLHDTLKLSADQEGAWKKFTDSMQPAARPSFNPDEMAKLTAPERADKMLELSQQRLAQAQKHAASLKEFYAVLNPEQKRAFDAFHAAHQGHASMKGGHGHRGGMHGGPGMPL